MREQENMLEQDNSKITVVRGNITEQPDCDAIVNSANRSLQAGAGVCGAIYDAACPKLEPCSVQLAPLALGAAVVTPGFNLPNRLIIHTLGPKYLIDPDPAANLASAMRNTLLLADENKVTRLAVPAISMGIFAFPQQEAIPILVRTAREMVKQLQYVKEIRFVVLDDDFFARFSEEIRNSAHLE